MSEKLSGGIGMENDLGEERRRMVEEQIQRRGIREPQLLNAFLKVPRHEFVGEELRSQAYRDGPLPIGHGQTISQPFMVAEMTRLGRIRPGHRVLEIGTGSGYQAAIAAELGADVFTVERISELAGEAAERLRRLGYGRVRVKVDDGTLGWPEEAPFDVVIVTAGAPRVPEPLLAQLKVGGRLIIPVAEGVAQVLRVVTRTSDEYVEERGESCTFVPLIGRHGWQDKIPPEREE